MLSKILCKFCCFFIFPFILQAVTHEIEIEERDIKSPYRVQKDGNVKKGYKKIVFNRFLESGLTDQSWEEFHGTTITWDSFKEELKKGDKNRKKGIAAEVATIRFFGILGYQILEDHYNKRKNALSNAVANSDMRYGDPIRDDPMCTTKFGSDNGIDGLFIHLSEKGNEHSHLIINEAKFRDKESLYASDFGTIENDEIRQSHSKWNRKNFSRVPYLSTTQYDDEIVIRTATHLNENGFLKLYEIKDKVVSDSQQSPNEIIYASKAPKQYSIRNAYSTFIQNVEFSLKLAKYHNYSW